MADLFNLVFNRLKLVHIIIVYISVQTHLHKCKLYVAPFSLKAQAHLLQNVFCLTGRKDQNDTQPPRTPQVHQVLDMHTSSPTTLELLNLCWFCLVKNDLYGCMCLYVCASTGHVVAQRCIHVYVCFFAIWFHPVLHLVLAMYSCFFSLYIFSFVYCVCIPMRWAWCVWDSVYYNANQPVPKSFPSTSLPWTVLSTAFFSSQTLQHLFFQFCIRCGKHSKHRFLYRPMRSNKPRLPCSSLQAINAGFCLEGTYTAAVRNNSLLHLIWCQ